MALELRTLPCVVSNKVAGKCWRPSQRILIRNAVPQNGRIQCRRHSSIKSLPGKVLRSGIAASLCLISFWNAPLPNFAVDSAASMEQELLPIPTEFPALPDFSFPPYEKIVLENGLRVFLLEDHELGLVGGNLIVKGGGNLDPEDKVGLARMTSAVQRSGGTALHPADSLDTELESMAARIEASSSLGSTSVGFRCLEEDLKTVFSIFADVIQRPQMPQEKTELVRGQLLGSISRRKDDPDTVASLELRKLLYGKESIYARLPEENTVRSISRDDLIKFHKNVFRPDGAVLGIWGDFDITKMKALIEKEFSTWRTSAGDINGFVAVKNKLVEPATSDAEPKVFVVDSPGLTQGYVRMGELGTTISDPDVFSLDVLNGVLNGFGGLLFDEVRSKEGLAYSVSGGWSPSIEHRGTFVAGGETQVQYLPRFLKAVKTVLMSVIEKRVSEERLARAKEAALNSFVFNFSSRESQLARILVYDLFGIDQNLPFTYKKRVEEVTGDDILQAAQKHLHPDLEPVVIVTDAEVLKPQMPAFVLQGQ